MCYDDEIFNTPFALLLTKDMNCTDVLPKIFSSDYWGTITITLVNINLYVNRFPICFYTGNEVHDTV